MAVAVKILQLIAQAKEEGLTIQLSETKEIIQASRAISKEPEVLEKLLYLLTICSNKVNAIKELSERQFQILNLIGLGFKSKDIASVLGISEYTVSTHRKNISKKLKLSGTGQLHHYAFTTVSKNLKQ